MSRPLEGLRVVEVAMWAFVPAAAAILSDMGADVIKVETHGGDPIRGLTTSGIPPGAYGFTFMWEIFNRGKRSITIDLNVEGATDVLHRLLADADVFLTSLLPQTRRKLKIDVEDVMNRHPKIIYAVGSGQGAFGPDAEKGGFDGISFWSRGGTSSGLTPEGQLYPVGMPGPAFGDSLSGAIFAGGIAAAIAKRALTGKPSIVDASLFGTSVWAMQPGIVATSLTGELDLPRTDRFAVPNPLVNTYRTSDSRYIRLAMLQGQKYWAGLCRAIKRDDLIDDHRFQSDAQRAANVGECIALLDEIFASRPLSEWKNILASQEGQWDVIKKVGEILDDPQVAANKFIQDVDYGDGRLIKMASVPIQFDREHLPARPAPALGEHSDTVLSELGYDEQQILDFRIAGIVL